MCRTKLKIVGRVGFVMLLLCIAGRAFYQAHLDASLEGAIEYSGGDPSEVRSLLASGADIETRDHEARTPLLQAVSYGHYKIVVLLLQRGAHVNVANVHGITPLNEAAAIGRADILRELLARGARVDVRDKDGKTALGWALRNAQEARTPDPTNQWHDDFPATIALLRQAGAVP